MAKKFDTTRLDQLSKAAGYSYKQLEPFRINRLKLMRQYVGTNYSDNGADKDVPINLIEMAMNIYLQRLVAQAPAVSIKTDFEQLKEICTKFEVAGNQLIKEIVLGDTLEMAVVGAILSMGTVKVGLNRTRYEIGGVTHDAGQPFADYVSLDDRIRDMTVDRAENSQFDGNFWYPTMDEACDLFHKTKAELIPQSEQRAVDRDHNLSEDKTNQREEYRETVRLLDLWLPKENLILQCQTNDDDTDPIGPVLNEVDWDGPERGPYHDLGFGKIENNIMPLAPGMLWHDLHDLANKLFRKLSRQAGRQKTVTGVRAAGNKDGNRVIDAEDGEMIALDDPKNVGEYKYGGIAQENLAFFIHTKDLFSYFAGNLDMLGGLGPQSETLGQDQLLSASASMRIQKMQKRTEIFTRGVIEDLMFYLYTDPYIQIPGVKRIEGFEDIQIPFTFGPEDREADFLQYNIKIEPYSMQHKTPEAKLQALRTIFAEMLVPLSPVMQAQGITINFEKYLKIVGKLGNIPELNDILEYSTPDPNQPVGQPPQKAPVTTRRYERTNRPGATDRGKSQILQSALLGGKPQDSEMASLTRATA